MTKANVVSLNSAFMTLGVKQTTYRGLSMYLMSLEFYEGATSAIYIILYSAALVISCRRDYYVDLHHL